MTSSVTFVDLARKGVEAGLREIGQATEMRQARHFASAMPDIKESGLHVAFLTPKSWAVHVQWEAMIGHALQLRDARVSYISCGGGFEICDRVNTYEGPPPPCRSCTSYTSQALAAHGYEPRPMQSYGTEVDEVDWPELDALARDELFSVEADGLPLGRHCEVPVRWHLCNSDLEADPIAGLTTRAFLRTARRAARVLRRSLEDLKPDVLFMVNGLFLFEALAADVAEQMGIRVVSYERGLLPGSLRLAHGPIAQRYDSSRLWNLIKDHPLTSEQDERLDGYMADRRTGRRTTGPLWPKQRDGSTPWAEKAASRRVVLFTNVTWDSAVLLRDSPFGSIREWMIDSIEHIASRPDTQLVVRVHPAEVRIPGWQTREPAMGVIDRYVPELPHNVLVVPPEDAMSSYDLMEWADVGFVYTSTTGLEMALGGTPVVCGARSHFSGLGITNEVDSSAGISGYHRLVDAVLDDPEGHRPDVETARRYANVTFFDSCLAFPFVEEHVKGLVRLTTTDPADLMPGVHRDLDTLCRGILEGSVFGRT